MGRKGILEWHSVLGRQHDGFMEAEDSSALVNAKAV